MIVRKGHLGAGEFGALLRVIATGGAAVTVALSRGGLTRRLRVEDGLVRLLIEPERRAAAVEQVLLRQGRLTPALAAGLRAEAARGDGSFGALLVGRGILTAPELQGIERSLAAEELTELMGWPEADYETSAPAPGEADPLPALPVANLVEAADVPAPRGAPAAATATILLIDDITAVRKTLREILEEGGYAVVEAGSMGEALDKVRKVRIDAVISDVMLKDGDGVALCDTLRRHAPTRAVPIVLISGFGTKDLIRRAKAAGADTFLVKPVDAKRLLGETARLLAK
jgi:CheY-like chemotaxis protein